MSHVVERPGSVLHVNVAGVACRTTVAAGCLAPESTVVGEKWERVGLASTWLLWLWGCHQCHIAPHCAWCPGGWLHGLQGPATCQAGLPYNSCLHSQSLGGAHCMVCQTYVSQAAGQVAGVCQVAAPLYRQHHARGVLTCVRVCRVCLNVAGEGAQRMQPQQHRITTVPVLTGLMQDTWP